VNFNAAKHGICGKISSLAKREVKTMAKYVVELSAADLQMLKDCHSKNPSIMKALEKATEK